MTLWVMCVLMTLAVVLLLLSPLFFRKSELPMRGEYDLMIYRDQLAEIAKEMERGLLVTEQAEAAKQEIYRRILAVQHGGVLSSGGKPSKIVLVVIACMCVPVGAWTMYAYMGSPALPAKPYAQRANDPDFIMGKEAEQLAAKLEANPDADGYQHLGDAYAMLHRYDLAAQAYEKLVQFNGGVDGNSDANVWAELGEALIMAQDGTMTPEAHMTLRRALKLDPHEHRALFYIGLLQAQQRNLREAVAIWRYLEEDSPSDAPWLPVVRANIVGFAKEGGFDPQSVSPAPPKE